MGAVNSCSYSDLAIQQIDNAVIDAQRAILFYFGWYRDSHITTWTGDIDKVNLLLEFLNFLDENL